jgi:hypothetical protein
MKLRSTADFAELEQKIVGFTDLRMLVDVWLPKGKLALVSALTSTIVLVSTASQSASMDAPLDPPHHAAERPTDDATPVEGPLSPRSRLFLIAVLVRTKFSELLCNNRNTAAVSSIVR